MRFRQRAWHRYTRVFRGEVRVRASPRSLPAPTATGARGRASDIIESQRIDYGLVCMKYLLVRYVSQFHLVYCVHSNSLTVTKGVTKLIQRHIGSVYGAFVPLYFTKVTRVENFIIIELN